MTTAYFNLAAGNLTQDWSGAGLFTVDDSWANVPSITGYRGDTITGSTGTDPRTLTAGSTSGGVVDINFNQTNPNTFTTGGVTRFSGANVGNNTVVALAGSGTGTAPSLVFYLDATGRSNISFAAVLRDLETGTDNAVQQIALQYRTSPTGAWTNVSYVADATTGPSTAGTDIALTGTLGSDANGQAQVEIRVLTTNAPGNDEWVGVDNIVISSDAAIVDNTQVTINDISIVEGNAGTSIATFTITRSANTGAFSLDFATANGTATAGSDYVANSGTVTFAVGGALTQTVSVTINGDVTAELNETFTVNLSNLVNTSGTATIADAQGQGTITNDDITTTAIHDIQGAAHISPLAGQSVTTTGIVTAVATNGFYLQARDADADGDLATSEAVFVFTGTAPTVVAGQEIYVTGTVTEFIPGGAASNNLSTTELASPSNIVVISSNNALPSATVIGIGGRLPPTEVIDSDNLGTFNPNVDGIDFYESLEGMRVTIHAPRAVSGTNSFGEIFTVADNGANATGLTARGSLISHGSTGDGLNVTNTGPGSDFNPERIQIDAGSFTPGTIPTVDVGAVLNDVTGVVGYSFGNFEVLATSAVTVASASTLTQEVTTLVGTADRLTIADFNVENLDANDSDGDTDIADGRFTEIANQVVLRLGTPDIIALQEIQDNSGSVDNGVTSASLTLQTLVNAIDAAGGPHYSFIDNPFITNNTNGGQPGGNIRVAYLYNAARVTLTGISTTPDAATAFAGSRPPLVANFGFHGETVTVIDNHFSSKGGSSALFGSVQPSINGAAAARLAQAQNVADYVASLGAASKVVVLGDLNEFTNEESLAPLYSAGLSALSLTLPPTERYSYVFEGNAQELDQVFVSSSLTANSVLDIVHTNSEFADRVNRASDHDPSVLAISFAAPVIETQSLGFLATSVSVAEGNSGTTNVTFTVQRTGGTTGQIDFSGSFAGGTTTATDFGGTLPSGFSGSILAGQTSATVTIAVSGDTIVEANESFGLTLTGGTNSAATVQVGAASTAIGTIVNDDLIDLSTYIRVGRYDLPEPTRTAAPANNLLAQEVSAVTYNKDTNTLFVLGDGGTAIVQVSLTGQLINSMTLAPGSSPQGTTFYDPEGLAYIGNGQFVFTEERDRNAVKFTYVADTVLTRADVQTANLGTNVGNIGLEGVTYDPLTGGFIFAKEKSSEGIFQTTIDFATNTASNGSATTVNSIDLFDPTKLNLLDFADLYALSNVAALQGTSQQGSLLVLSQESGRIVLTDRAGNVSSALNIVSDPGNPLDVVAQQHEGITVGPDGTIYVVSENGGGDFDHPQLWVYRQSLVPNQAPTAITLANTTTAILENTSTQARIKVADVVVTDDGLGTNSFSVSGADAAAFEVDSTGLYIKAGTLLDFETKASYAVTVNVDDPSVGATPDASTNFNLSVTDVTNESALPNVYVSEVAPWSSGNSAVAADWFEVTNGGSAALNISGWRFDDNSNSFGASVALTGVTSLAAGESVIFLETTPANAAATIARFVSTWFGGTAPAGLQFGTYSGSGVGLSTSGDAVNLFDTTGTLRANVVFGTSPAGPFATFNNAAGSNNATISTLSSVGTNGAYAPNANEIGSPGTVGRLIISEVAPWSSGNSPVGADWFEVSNTSVAAINVAGWKIDDNSGSPAAAVALVGVTSIAAGESVIFIEATPANAAATIQNFINTWFGGNAPANLQIGTYSGAGVGLGAGGDAVNLYDSANALRASVTFGASPTGPFATFDNAAGLNNATIAQLSALGTNGAHRAANDTAETGSPGAIVARNDAPIGRNDTATGLVEDGNTAAGGNVLTNDSDADRVQTTTEVLRVNGVRSGAEAAGGSLTTVAGATVVDGIYGALTINTDGSYAYALDNSRAVTQALQGGATASDTFTYRVADNAGATDTAQLSVTITGSNDAPVLTGTPAVLAHGTEDVAYTVLASDLLTGFTDVDGNTLTVSGLTASTGTVIDNGDGSFTITPAANVNGAVTLSYAVVDGQGGATSASLGYIVDPVNDAPVLTGAPAVLAHGTEDVAYTVLASDLLAGFSDVDGDGLAVSGLAASSGTVIDNGDGSFTITPAADVNGAVTLSYAVVDGQGGVTSASLGYIVDPVNDAPVLTGAPAVLANGTEDVAYTVLASDLLAGFSDVDGDGLAVSGLTASSGTVTDNGNGSFTITQTANANGAVTLSYAVVDGQGGVTSASLGYSVDPVNDAPVAQSANAIGAEDTAIFGQLVATDIDSSGLTFAAVTGPQHGALTLNTDGSYSYTPFANYNGTDSFSFAANDGGLNSNVAVVALTITPVNDAPTAIALASRSIAENSSNGRVVGTLATTDIDNSSGFTYTLLTNAGGRFAVNAATGVITVANGALLDYETARSHVIDVRVTDAGGLSYQQALTIDVTNVFETHPLNGTSGADVLTATSDDPYTVLGLAGNDTITTLGGNDYITAGGGNDTISSGAGNDTIVAGASSGFDSVDGGAGIDTIVASGAGIVIGLTHIAGIEIINANSNAGVRINGSAADDILDFTGVQLIGIGSIGGGAGNDTIIGSAGNDRIIGGAGADVLSGGGGNNVFAYSAISESGIGVRADRIFDFHTGDIVDLSAIDANASVAGNQSFTFIGSAPFTGLGQLRLGDDGAGHVAIFANVAGNTNADFEIIFYNHPTALVAADFVL